MFKIDENYSQYRDDHDPKYPGGKAIDAPSGDSIEGTQYTADFFNQIFGFFQATLFDAYGEMRMSGLPDNASESDVLEALKAITAKVTNAIQELVDKNIIDIKENFIEHLDLLNLIRQNETKITVLENSLYMDVVANPFIVEFLNLDGINLIRGNWNIEGQSVECSRYNDDITVTFHNLGKIKLIEGIWNAPYNQLEC